MNEEQSFSPHNQEHQLGAGGHEPIQHTWAAPDQTSSFGFVPSENLSSNQENIQDFSQNTQDQFTELNSGQFSVTHDANNLQAYPIFSYLRAITPMGILDHAYTTYRQYWKLIFLFTFLIVFFYTLPVEYFVSKSVDASVFPWDEAKESWNGEDPLSQVNIGILSLQLILASLSSYFIGGGICAILRASTNNIPIKLGDIFQATFKKTGIFIGVFFVVLIPKVIAFFFCLFPVFPVIAFFSLTVPIIIFENSGIIDAIRRSVTLVKKRFGASLGLIILSTILSISSLTFPRLLYSVLVTWQPWMGNFLISSLSHSLFQALLIPPSFLVAILLYFDIRVRVEGFDIQVRLPLIFEKK